MSKSDDRTSIASPSVLDRTAMPSRPRIWLAAARPRTLSAALCPVVLGAALAFGDDVHHPLSILAALVGATFIQIGTNFANDYFDFVKGTDDHSRIGPARATAKGWVTPKTMAIATASAFALAIVAGIYLIVRGGTPILVIGALSILSGVLYTGGPKPLGYVGLGDVFVLVFFGPIAVAGTYWVQSHTLSWAAILVGFATGFLATAILVVNNLRDRTGDARSGKRTLVVRFGEAFGRSEYVACFVLAALATGFVPLLRPDRAYAAVAVAVAIPAFVVAKHVVRIDGARLNPFLGRTAALQLLHAILLSLGWCLS
ncbi:MAG: 1,4-dihydroxy-2-naphthoate polyprenyltransferase [Planctomycetes bacterium]|nr:1,4-dihydroxy-2-naphthoate polyprenyltransferase [Planctomycetota bacterium]MCB9917827.1 1,4-dihydroxy-2-naphthoate polyprenyltransferase [Planctomycetota bacterium]